jgi:glycosyltransferase involved in cell wall biosynthesis
VMSTQEGLERLIDAADHIVRRRGREDVHFALVGPGDAHDGLRRDIAARGLDRFVELTGAVGDELVRAYLSTADVCVGVDEPNAMNDRAAMRKVLEYMALGRAVVQFPLTEMQRLCGDASVYARSCDAADLAAKICALLDDDERREALGEIARARVSNGLMWPQQIPALLAAVDAALVPAAARRPSDSGPRTQAAPFVALASGRRVAGTRLRRRRRPRPFFEGSRHRRRTEV